MSRNLGRIKKQRTDRKGKGTRCLKARMVVYRTCNPFHTSKFRPDLSSFFYIIIVSFLLMSALSNEVTRTATADKAAVTTVTTARVARHDNPLEGGRVDGTCGGAGLCCFLQNLSVVSFGFLLPHANISRRDQCIKMAVARLEIKILACRLLL